MNLKKIEKSTCAITCDYEIYSLYKRSARRGVRSLPLCSVPSSLREMLSFRWWTMAKHCKIYQFSLHLHDTILFFKNKFKSIIWVIVISFCIWQLSICILFTLFDTVEMKWYSWYMSFTNNMESIYTRK